ncbi:hypothetical protein LCM17_10630 [Cereibacter sphaeroides]|nr:hypothetical protein [Cereibacter sphaeroides]
MRDLPPPRIPDAVPMPGGDSRDWVQHPGPEQQPRHTALPCRAETVTLELPAGAVLLEAVAEAVAASGADGACVVLDGVQLAQAHWVMPDGPADDQHAAWYSETYSGRDITLDRATASVGQRDGAWFLHCHALWRQEGGLRMGHLLNDACTLGAPARIEAHLIFGARLDVTPDPETRFPLFAPMARGEAAGANAALITIRPHEDLHAALAEACREAGLERAALHGIGSLIGAGFRAGPAMSASLSEVLLLPGCRFEGGQCTALPLAAIDPFGGIHQGDLLPGEGPVCVTFEVLAVAC